MSRIGVIYCAWQSEDMVERSLAPWIAARETKLGGHEWVICAVSVPFEGFPQEETLDQTRSILGAHSQYGRIDHVVVNDKAMKETGARGRALRWLVDSGVRVVIQVDADEEYTLDDILHTFAFVEANPWVTWFRLSLRNAVFDKHTFLVEPFTPPRIHRVYTDKGYAERFWDDNNVEYDGDCAKGAGDKVYRDVELSTMTIPPSVAWPKHLTWLNDARSRRKVEYQTKARGWECSFRWDEEKGLQFNEAFYAARGLPLPEVITEMPRDST